jgi:AcrR family transcriptional regulator
LSVLARYRHYESKAGLCAAVDDHVAGVFELMLAQASDPSGAGPLALSAVPPHALAAMAAAGSADPGADPEVRAAFLLVNDLAVLILRTHLRDVLGVDPLSAAGMRRWGAEVLSIYRAGRGSPPSRN